MTATGGEEGAVEAGLEGGAAGLPGADDGSEHRDIDFAHPAARLDDVAYALEYTAPFRDDAECVRSLSFPAPPDRRADQGHEPRATWAADGFLDELEGRVAWSRSHRHLFEGTPS